MSDNFNTSRLILDPLHPADATFMLELVNSDGWIRFIGNRNIKNSADAAIYVDKLRKDQNVRCWTVKLREGNTPVGTITFIKRKYLDYHDIGFAFLPEYNGKGYAEEAASAVMSHFRLDPEHPRILATTLRENINSIRLLKKLGLAFEREILVEKETLLLFGVDTDTELLQALF